MFRIRWKTPESAENMYFYYSIEEVALQAVSREKAASIKTAFAILGE